MGHGGHGSDVDIMTLLQWYDTWLKGRNTPMRTTKTPLHMRSLGTKTWVNTSTYPLTNAYSSLYLAEGGALKASRAADGGGDSLQYTQPSAPGGQLSYTSQPFPDGATVAGPVSATLYASTTGSNLHLITELQGVAPDGTTTRLTSGNQVASLRALEPRRSWTDSKGVMVRPYGSFEEDDYLEPGEVARVDVALSPRIAVLEPGHALRLVITTQVDPRTCGPLLGVNPCFPTATQLRTLPGTYSLARSAQYPSSLNLPLLSRTCLPSNAGSDVQPSTLRGPVRSASSPCVSSSRQTTAVAATPAPSRADAARALPATSGQRLPATGTPSALTCTAAAVLAGALLLRRRRSVSTARGGEPAQS
jgi:predicted acyl esterase